MNAVEINEKVTKRIKDARNEKEYSQEVLAEALNKTRAAISDMERGKVQVSAGELYILAKLLDKPIEYFYGEDFSGEDVQNIIAITRMQSPETRLSTIEIATMIMKLLSVGKKAEKYKKGKEIPNELVQEFYDTFIPFAQAINIMSEKITKLRDQFDEEIKVRNMKITDKK